MVRRQTIQVSQSAERPTVGASSKHYLQVSQVKAKI